MEDSYHPVRSSLGTFWIAKYAKIFHVGNKHSNTDAQADLHY